MPLISKICFWNKNRISIFIFKFRQGIFFFLPNFPFTRVKLILLLWLTGLQPSKAHREAESTIRVRQRDSGGLLVLLVGSREDHCLRSPREMFKRRQTWSTRGKG